MAAPSELAPPMVAGKTKRCALVSRLLLSVTALKNNGGGKGKLAGDTRCVKPKHLQSKHLQKANEGRKPRDGAMGKGALRGISQQQAFAQPLSRGWLVRRDTPTSLAMAWIGFPALWSSTAQSR